MICPHCNHKMACNQTKNYHDPKGFNYVERRRICMECDTRFYTIEVPANEFNQQSKVNGDNQED